MIAQSRYWILLILLVCLTACHSNVDATDSRGKSIRMTDYQGKWVVINYWATWCKPCLKELPELNMLSNQHADKVVVLGVNFDHLDPMSIQRFAASFPLNFSLLSQFPIEKFGVKDISTLPVTFIINPQGKLTQTLYGPQTQHSLLTAIGEKP